jgi:DNA-binding MarR family transcriptional regulator
MNTDITIPAAYYDEVSAQDLNALPQEQEIRLKGKGKQYVIDRNDPKLALFIGVAKLEYKDNGSASAENLLRSLEKQGVDTGADLPVREPKPVTRRTTAQGDRRNLIVTITPEGELILRPAGRRRSVSISLSAVYSIAVNAEARQAIAAAKKKRKERSIERRAVKAAAAINFKNNPNSITL